MNELAQPNSVNKFSLIAAESASGNLIGARMRFEKGAYYVSKGYAEELPLGTRLLVIDIAAAWVKWVGDRIVATHTGLPLPHRDDLDDIELAGSEDDPWKCCRYMYLTHDDGREYTFTTSSWGGRSAVDRLSGQIGQKQQQTRSLVMPMIELASGVMQSPRFGQVPAPRFPIVAWPGLDEAPSSPPLADPPATRIRGRNEDLDDEIPF
jgi:hypothetical protein